LEENDKALKAMEKKKVNQIEEYGKLIQKTYLSNGLTEKEVLARRERDGPNYLPDKKSVPEIVKLLRELTNVFSCLLWGFFHQYFYY
jgi:hypothetical protein